jgi:hypothetical protein
MQAAGCCWCVDKFSPSALCPACGQGVESLSHLMFDCPATSVQRDTMFDEIRSALQDVAGGAEKLRNVLSLPDASTKLFPFSV